MTLIQTVYRNCIALQGAKEGARSGKVEALALVLEKSLTESKHNLLRCKNIVNIITFNVRTLNTINQLPELAASAVEHNIDIMYMQEHKYYHSELELKYHDIRIVWTFVTSFARKKTQSTGSVGILLSLCALKALNSIEETQPRIM